MIGAIVATAPGPASRRTASRPSSSDASHRPKPEGISLSGLFRSPVERCVDKSYRSQAAGKRTMARTEKRRQNTATISLLNEIVTLRGIRASGKIWPSVGQQRSSHPPFAPHDARARFIATAKSSRI
jgi:hypothetical protein